MARISFRRAVLAVSVALLPFASGAATMKVSAGELSSKLADVSANEEVEIALVDAEPNLASVVQIVGKRKFTLDLSECKSLKSIPARAFFLMGNLAGVKFPDTLEEIGDKAFTKTSLSSVEIPASVKKIGLFAFAETKLTKVLVPAGVSELKAGAFAEIKTLSSIDVDSASKSYKSEDGILFTRDGLTIVTYPAGKSGASYEIPAGVVSVGTAAFARNESISDVKIPESVLRICGFAFRDCPSIQKIEIPSKCVSIGRDAFDGTAIGSISIPKTVATLGENPFNRCAKLSAITVEEGNVAYNSNDGVLFSVTKELLRYPPAKNAKSYDIPAGTLAVGPAAFAGAVSLESVSFPDGASEIGKYSFRECKSLKSVSLSPSVRKIGRMAFFGCPPVEGLPEDFTNPSAKDYIKKTSDADAK